MTSDFEEGEADFAEGVVDVLVGEGALAAEGLEGALEFFGEVFKHGYIKFSKSGTGWQEQRKTQSKQSCGGFAEDGEVGTGAGGGGG